MDKLPDQERRELMVNCCKTNTARKRCGGFEEDQVAFAGFVDQLRRAKDRSDFDRFMEERRLIRSQL